MTIYEKVLKNYCNPKKDSILIMAAEGYGFEESEYWYDRLEKHLGWASLGKEQFGLPKTEPRVSTHFIR